MLENLLPKVERVTHLQNAKVHTGSPVLRRRRQADGELEGSLESQ